MKCIRCNHDSKYRERPDRCCPKCRKPFAFEPRAGDPLTDGVFAAAIDRVSSRGTVRFLLDHLYYEVCRRHRRGVTAKVVTTAILLGVLFVILTAVFGIGMLPVTLLLALIAFALWYTRSQSLRDRRHMPREMFDGLWSRFVSAHGAPQMLIKRDPLASRTAPRHGELSEMLNYSFDRAVICDRAQTVDLLLANQFHFENNCAVLSVDGHPQHAFETVRRMLKNNPRLLVFALHDANEDGCRLAYDLRNDPAWFKGGAPVFDVGLRPVHHRSFLGQEVPREPRRAVKPGEGISVAEALWLSRSTLPLAIVVPEQIIKRLYRAITVAEDRQTDSDTSSSGDSGGSSSGSDLSSDSRRHDAHAADDQFDLDADLSDGGGDSFG